MVVHAGYLTPADDAGRKGSTPAASTPRHFTARALEVLGDPVTTDHICPAGSIVIKNPPGQYLMDS